MATVTVEPWQPAELYPFGVQGPLTITNLGPATIYLDSDSSVGPQSLPLGPNDAITWDGGQPLWAVARLLPLTSDISGSEQSSRVSIIRNGGGYSPQGDVTRRLLQDASFTFGGSAFYSTNALEVGAYQTLRLWASMTNPDGSVIYATQDDKTEWRFTWYDEAGNWLSDEELWQLNCTEGVRITVPVRGSYVVAQLFYEGPTYPNMILKEFTVTATTAPGHYQSLIGLQDQSLRYAGGQTVSSDGYAFVPNYDFANPILLSSWGTKLSIGIVCTAAITTAGRLVVKSGKTRAAEIPVFEDIELPVAAAAQRLQTTTKVPISQPIYVTGVAPTGGAPVNLTFTWEDFQP